MEEKRMAKTSQAKILAQMRYNAKTYEQINFQVKKGMKDFYKQAAADRNIGFHEMIRDGIDEYIQNHPVDKEGG